MDNAEFSPQKARDLLDLAGEASLAGFFAAGELTRTDFDFLHDGLAFSGVARVLLLLCIGVSVKDVLAAFTNSYSCPKLRIFRPHGLQTRSEIEGNLARKAILLHCKFRIDGLQSNPAVWTV